MVYTGPPLPPPTVLTALALGDPPDDITRVIPPKDQPFAAASYSIDLFDDGMFKRSTSASPVTVTIPANADIPMPFNSTIHFMQGGAGNITFAPASGVTLNAQGGTLTTSAQWTVVHLWQYDIDRWVLYGSGFGGGGGGEATPPSPPNMSVQYDNSGAFGGDANWIFDPAGAGFTLGLDTQYYREAAHTVGVRAPEADVPLSVRVYGRFDPESGSADNFDRLVLGNWELETANDDFFMGIALESEWDIDGYVLLQPCGGGGIVTKLPDQGSWRLDPRGVNAIDLQFNQDVSNQIAGADYSAIIGGEGHEIDPGADYSGIFAGQSNTIDPTAVGGIGTAYDSAICGGRAQYISGDNSFIGAGEFNSILGSYCAIVGGQGNQVGSGSNLVHGAPPSNQSAIVGGDQNLMNADNAAILAGTRNYVDSAGAVAMGNSAHTRGVPNCFAQGAGQARYGGGTVYWPGQMQSVSYVLQVRTITNVETVMTTDGNTPVAANSLVVRHDAGYMFEARIVAKHLGFAEGAAFIVTGLVARGIAPGTIALVGTPTVTVIARTDPLWSVAVGVNTTLGSLEFKVTGTNPGTVSGELWWCAQVRTAEAYTDESTPS